MYDEHDKRDDVDFLQSSPGKALVVIADDRVALATVLVLQEMNLAVDIAIDGDSAIAWSKRAGYDVIVCGPGGDAAVDLALRFRMSAPDAQVFLLTAPGEETTALWILGVELIAPPLNVNTLVGRFWRTAA